MVLDRVVERPPASQDGAYQIKGYLARGRGSGVQCSTVRFCWCH